MWHLDALSSPIMLLCCPSPLRWMSSLWGWQNVSSRFLKSRVTTWHIKQTEGPWRTWCSSQDNVFPSNHWQKVRAFSFSGLGAIPSERQPSLENYEVPLMTFFFLTFSTQRNLILSWAWKRKSHIKKLPAAQLLPSPLMPPPKPA